MSRPQGAGILFEQETEEELVEVNLVVLTGERLECDGLADESPADGTQAAVDFDAAF